MPTSPVDQTSVVPLQQSHGITFIDLDLSDYPLQAFKAGDVIFNDGAEAIGAYVIESGLVEIFKTNPRGEGVTLAMLRPGIMFGELALIGDKPRSAAARAMTDTTVRFLTRKDFERVMADLTPMGRRVIELLIYTLYRSTNTVVLSSMTE